MEKKCLKQRLEEVRKEKWDKFKKFGDDCFCPNDFGRKSSEFRRINTMIQLGTNEMEKNCTKKEKKCPSEFCAEIYKEIMEVIPKEK